MSLPGEWFRRARYLLHRRRLDDELRREMEAHREMMRTPARFGNTTRLHEDARDVWGWRWLDDLLADARYAVRTLSVSHRTFGMTAVAMLAIGLGVTTAVFSVLSGLLLQPLPFPSADRLVQVHGTASLPGQQWSAVMNLDAHRHESTSFAALAGYEVGARYLRDAGGTERVMSVRTEPDFFTVLGVEPLAGRAYRTGDDPRSAVIGETFWRHRLGADPAIVGRALVLDGQPFTVVGVMRESFQFPYRSASLLQGVADHARTDVWTPFDRPLNPRGRIGNVVGRLKPGVPLAAAQHELSAIARRLEEQYPDTNRGRGIAIVPLAQEVVPAPTRRLLFLLFGAVGIVLALACANVTNLALARMMLRQREVAVRAALGASPLRLVRQFLAEGLVIALSGGVLGALLAWWIVRRLVVIAAPFLPRAHEVGLDWRVFAFVAAVCVVVAAAVSAAPAVIAARRDPRNTLQEAGTASTMSPTQRRLRNGLVVAEVALAFVLGVGSALLVRELARLRGTDAGIVPANVITFHVGQPRNPDIGMQFYDIADRVAGLPGVQAAGFAQMLPLQSWGWTSNSTDFRVRGRPPRAEEFSIELRYVTPGYFDALGITLRRGRGFTPADVKGTLPVIVINETLARRAFPGEDPIGLETTRGTIVGTIADVRQANLELPAAPEVYYPIAQNWSQVSDLGMTLVVRTADRPEPIIDAVRSTIRDVSADHAVFGIKTMSTVLAESLSGFTLSLSILSAFAVLAIVLALYGTYGVISYLASSRAREFAIRIALGAGRGRVITGVLRQGLTLTALGLGVGTVAALLAAPLLGDAPVSIRQPDLVTLLPVALVIAIVAAVAVLVPARRAARVDPVGVLRGE